MKKFLLTTTMGLTLLASNVAAQNAELQDIPPPIQYSFPQEYYEISKIDDKFKPIVKFIDTLYRTEPFLYWKEDFDNEGGIILNGFYYIHYTPYRDVANREYFVEEAGKAAIKHRVEGFSLRLLPTDEGKIIFTGALPDQYTITNLVPWNYDTEPLYKFRNAETTGIWDIETQSIESISVYADKIIQMAEINDAINITVDNPVFNYAKEKNLELGGYDHFYSFQTEDLAFYDPSTNTRFIDLTNLRASSVIEGAKTDIGNFIGSSLFSVLRNVEEDFNYTDETHLKNAKFYVTADRLDINFPDFNGAIKGKSNGTTSTKNLALNLQLLNFDQEKVNLVTKFDLETILKEPKKRTVAESVFFPQIISFLLKDEKGIDKETLLRSLILREDPDPMGQNIYRYDRIGMGIRNGMMKTDGKISIDNFIISHPSWNMKANGGLQFDPLMNEDSWMLKLGLGINGLQGILNYTSQQFPNWGLYGKEITQFFLNTSNAAIASQMSSESGASLSFSSEEELMINGVNVLQYLIPVFTESSEEQNQN